MMKKILAIIFAVTMVFCFTACGSSDSSSEPADDQETTAAEEEATAEDGPVSGGWEVVADPAEAELPDEVKAAFDNFSENYGDDFVPMAYYGYQVTEGMNYGILGKSKADNELQTLVLIKNPKYEAVDAIINTFNIADYTDGSGADVSAEALDGGWQVADDYTTAEIPKEAFEAYDAATAELTGNDLHPMAYLGSQVVAGTNYAFLCHSSLVTAEPVTSIQVVTVYEDLEGNCEVLNINTLDLASFAEED